MIVTIASRSESKVGAVCRAFGRYPDLWKSDGKQEYIILPKETETDPSDTVMDTFFKIPLHPMNSEGILHGVKVRAKTTFDFFAKKKQIQTYSAAVEGGCYELDGTYYMTAAAAIYDGKNYCIGFAPSFAMPKASIKRILAGEQCHLLTDIFGEVNSLGGIIGPLTKEQINREDYNEQAVIMALAQIVSKPIYNK